MSVDLTAATSWPARLEALRAAKLVQTQEKQAVIGAMDHDDWALILPPPDRRQIVRTMSPSGMPITDCLLEGYAVQANHPSGGFFGAASVGGNFRRLLDAHPVYLDPNSSLAGTGVPDIASRSWSREEASAWAITPEPIGVWRPLTRV